MLRLPQQTQWLPRRAHRQERPPIRFPPLKTPTINQRATTSRCCLGNILPSYETGTVSADLGSTIPANARVDIYDAPNGKGSRSHIGFDNATFSRLRPRSQKPNPLSVTGCCRCYLNGRSFNEHSSHDNHCTRFDREQHGDLVPCRYPSVCIHNNLEFRCIKHDRFLNCSYQYAVAHSPRSPRQANEPSRDRSRPIKSPGQSLVGAASDWTPRFSVSIFDVELRPHHGTTTRYSPSAAEASGIFFQRFPMIGQIVAEAYDPTD